MTRRVLITGGSGFIGTNLVEYFLGRGVPVLSLDRREPRVRAHLTSWERIDICDPDAMTGVFDRFAPTQVVHLAASTSFDDTEARSGHAVNSEGVAVLLSVLGKANARCRVFHASTMLVPDAKKTATEDAHGRRLKALDYGRSKAVGEQLLRDAPPGNFTWTIGRLTSIWGPWFGEPYRPFFELVSRGLYASPASSTATKTLGYVENTAHQIDALLLQPESVVQGNTFYLGDNPALNIADWADAIAAAFGLRRPPRAPMTAFQAAAALGDLLALLGIRFPMTRFRLHNMTSDNVVDVSPVTMLAGPGPVGLEQAIRRTVDWMRSQR